MPVPTATITQDGNGNIGVSANSPAGIIRRTPFFTAPINVDENGNIGVYLNDPNSVMPGGGLPEAPNDGKQYARQSNAWTEVASDLPSSPILDGEYALRVKGGVHSWLDIANRLLDEEYFAFTIDTSKSAGTTFAIPTSQVYPYDWLIDWGDGTAKQPQSGTGANNSAGISHTYASAGIYRITIRPNDTVNEWFRAFGFWNNISGANATENKQKLIEVNATLTTAMFAGLNATVLGNSIALYMFYGCSNLVSLSTGFSFPQNIVTVGGNFASNMFNGCTGLTSLPTNFNLSPKIMGNAGSSFLYRMFYGCTNLSSLPENFNFPQNITNVGLNSFSGVFEGCSELATVSENMNLPQNLTTIGTGLCSNMFSGCSKLVMNQKFMLPQSLTQAQVDYTSIAPFYQMFLNMSKQQQRTAASVIGILPAPTTASNRAFAGSGFSDKNTLPANWR